MFSSFLWPNLLYFLHIVFDDSTHVMFNLSYYAFMGLGSGIMPLCTLAGLKVSLSYECILSSFHVNFYMILYMYICVFRDKKVPRWLVEM